MGIEVSIFLSRSTPSWRSPRAAKMPSLNIAVSGRVLAVVGLASLILTAVIWVPRRRRQQAVEATVEEHQVSQESPATQ
jgi:hypothetical protein